MIELRTKGLSDLPKVIELVNGIFSTLKYLATRLVLLQQPKNTHVSKLIIHKRVPETNTDF